MRSASRGDDLAGERRRGVDAGADGGAAEGQLADAGQRVASSRSMAWPDLAGVAAELLAEGHRRRVHEVGAAGLDHLGELAALRRSDASRCVERRDEVVRDAPRWRPRGWPSREHVVGRLRRVDVVVGVDRLRRSFSVARVAITSLAFMFDDVPDPVWKTSIGNSSSQRPSATSSAAATMASAMRRSTLGTSLRVALTGRGLGLDQGEGADQPGLDGETRDGEVLDGALGLRRVLGVAGHFDGTHRVVFDAHLRIGGAGGAGWAHAPEASPSPTRPGQAMATRSSSSSSQ